MTSHYFESKLPPSPSVMLKGVFYLHAFIQSVTKVYTLSPYLRDIIFIAPLVANIFCQF